MTPWLGGLILAASVVLGGLLYEAQRTRPLRREAQDIERKLVAGAKAVFPPWEELPPPPPAKPLTAPIAEYVRTNNVEPMRRRRK